MFLQPKVEVGKDEDVKPADDEWVAVMTATEKQRGRQLELALHCNVQMGFFQLLGRNPRL